MPKVLVFQRNSAHGKRLVWALVISAPILLFPVLKTMPHNLSTLGWQSLTGFIYVSVVSMFLAFVVWYKGLALGGIARIGQLQLLQPFLTIFATSILLHEQVSWAEVLAALIVIACVLIGRRAERKTHCRRNAPARCAASRQPLIYTSVSSPCTYQNILKNQESKSCTSLTSC